METKRIVITGGPGSGKTSLINHLATEGYSVLHEISREVTLEAQKEGIEQLFLINPILFSKKLLEGRVRQFHQSHNFEAPVLFYDRGIPDVTAYLDYVDAHYPENFPDTCMEFRYDAIFVLPPWEAIYERDNERYESFEEAEKLFQYLKNTYRKYGYHVYEVPIGSVKDRVQFILDTLKEAY